MLPGMSFIFLDGIMLEITEANALSKEMIDLVVSLTVHNKYKLA